MVFTSESMLCGVVPGIARRRAESPADTIPADSLKHLAEMLFLVLLLVDGQGTCHQWGASPLLDQSPI